MFYTSLLNAAKFIKHKEFSSPFWECGWKTSSYICFMRTAKRVSPNCVGPWKINNHIIKYVNNHNKCCVCLMRRAKRCASVERDLERWRDLCRLWSSGPPTLPSLIHCAANSIKKIHLNLPKNEQSKANWKGFVCVFITPFQDLKMEIGLPLFLWCKLTLKFRSEAEKRNYDKTGALQALLPHTINIKWAVDKRAPRVESSED